MGEVKLKPCPFCGGEAELYEDGIFSGAFVYCKKCGTLKGYYLETEKAIEAWNRRGSDDSGKSN